jgi:hypothetical protein
MYGFCPGMTMGYGVSESMGYGSKFPANQLGILEIPWGIREYGLPGVWVKRGSNVVNGVFGFWFLATI